MHWEIWCEKDAAFRHSKVAAYGHKSQHKTNIPNLERTVAKNCKYQGGLSCSYVIITVSLLLYSNLPNASNHPHLFPSPPSTCPPSSAWTRISICRFLSGVLFLTPTPIILPGNLSNFHA